MKALLLGGAVLLAVACGDTAAPAGQPTESPAANEIATLTPPAIASPAPTPGNAAVSFLNAPLTVGRGQNAILQAKTNSNTSCSIEVDYKSGTSTAAGLAPKTSDGAGNVSWTWKVGANTTPGAWPITVTCGAASAHTQINVT